MSIEKREYINVLNFNENIVTIQTRDQGHKLNAASNDKATSIPLTWNEIDYIHSNTSAFSSGLLRFPEDIEKEVYEKLRIQNYESILKNTDIEDAILNPTMEKLQKFIDITDSSAFERVRGIFTKLKNSGHDVSVRVERIINERYKELLNRQTKSSIILTPKDTAIKSSEVDDLKAQIAQMQEMMAAFLKNQTDNITTPIVESVEDEPVEVIEPPKVENDKTDTSKKKAGRPPKESK